MRSSGAGEDPCGRGHEQAFQGPRNGHCGDGDRTSRLSHAHRGRSPVTRGSRPWTLLGERRGPLRRPSECGEIQNGGNGGHFVPSVSGTCDPVPHWIPRSRFHPLTAGVIVTLDAHLPKPRAWDRVMSRPHSGSRTYFTVYFQIPQFLNLHFPENKDTELPSLSAVSLHAHLLPDLSEPERCPPQRLPSTLPIRSPPPSPDLASEAPGGEQGGWQEALGGGSRSVGGQGRAGGGEACACCRPVCIF